MIHLSKANWPKLQKIDLCIIYTHALCLDLNTFALDAYESIYKYRSMCFNKVIIDENAAIGLLAQLVATEWKKFKAHLWFACLPMNNIKNA